jgi:hypothetical protein
MSDDQIPDGPRRETAASTLAARAARQLVKPVHEKIGGWQAESIKLETMAQRLKTTGRRDAAVGEAARTLLGFIATQADQFDTIVNEAPEAIRAHGRIADTRMVLRALEERLVATLTNLGEPPVKRR